VSSVGSGQRLRRYRDSYEKSKRAYDNFAGQEGGKAQRAPAQDSHPLNLELTIQAQQILQLERGRAALCPLPDLQVSGA